MMPPVIDQPKPRLVPRAGVRWQPPPRYLRAINQPHQGDAEKARRRRQMERAARKQEVKS